MPVPAEGRIVRLDVVLAEVLLVLEEAVADGAGDPLPRHVDVGDVLPKVTRIGENLSAELATLWLHAPPLAPPPDIYAHIQHTPHPQPVQSVFIYKTLISNLFQVSTVHSQMYRWKPSRVEANCVIRVYLVFDFSVWFSSIRNNHACDFR